MKAEENTDKQSKLRASDHDSYGTMTILALIIPAAGFILGIVYLAKDAKADRKLGEHLVACSVFASIAMWIIWFTYVTFAMA